MTQLATGLGVLARAALVKSIMDQKTMAGLFPRCPSCKGTGRVSCLCSCQNNHRRSRYYNPQRQMTTFRSIKTLKPTTATIATIATSTLTAAKRRKAKRKQKKKKKRKKERKKELMLAKKNIERKVCFLIFLFFLWV